MDSVAPMEVFFSKPDSPIKVGHIDDVQELRKQKPTTIPDRFVKDFIDRDKPILSTVLLPSPDVVPVIDLSKLVKCDQNEFCSEISQLAKACEEWGFFQVINHGVDLGLLERMESLAKEFFMLPLEEKKKYQLVPGTVQGYGQAFVLSEDQKLDWINMFALGVEPPFIRNPQLWPTNPPEFSQTIDEYSREVRKVCEKLMKYIAMSLGLKEDMFKEMFGAAVQAIRMNYYPSCSRPDLVLGLSPHSDGSALTILQQANDVVGLQILKDGKWVPIQPIPNAFVINVGDTLEVLTNGKYKSVEHRAVAHEDRDRFSMATFYAPCYEIEIGPIEALVNEETPCRYRRYNHGDYNKHYLTNRLRGKKNLDFAKIAT